MHEKCQKKGKHQIRDIPAWLCSWKALKLDDSIIKHIVERHEAIFPARATVGGSHYRKSPTHHEQDLILPESEFNLW